MDNKKIFGEKLIVSLVSFFSFSGYYAGLAIIISMGLTTDSRYYSVPLRTLTTLMMVYVIFNRYFAQKRNKNFVFIFLSFWFLYLLKLMYHHSEGYPLFREWYEYILYAVNYCICPFLMFSVIDFKKHKKTILNSLIFSGFLMAAICLYLYKNLLFIGLGRISDIAYENPSYETLSPLSLSYGGSLTLILCLYQFFFNRKELSFGHKLYLFVTMAGSLVLFSLGASRGSLIAVALCVPLFLIYSSFKQRTTFIFLSFLAIPILSSILLYLGSSILTRTGDTLSSGSFGRGELWSDAWQEFLNNPFFGGRIEINFYPHNFILETLMSTGFLGFILLLVIFFVGIKRVSTISFANKEYLIPFIIFIQGFTQYFFTGALYVSILLFLPLGIIYSSFNQSEQPQYVASQV